MTTIVTDGTLIAWDSQITVGTQRMRYPKHKVEFRRGKLFACAGSTPSVDYVCNWYEDGCPKDEVPSDNFEILVFLRDGTVHYLDNTQPFPEAVAAPVGVGSGSLFALGAMRFGANAVQACACACDADIYSSGPIYSLDVAKALHARSSDARIPIEHEVDDVLRDVRLQYTIKKLSEMKA